MVTQEYTLEVAQRNIPQEVLYESLDIIHHIYMKTSEDLKPLTTIVKLFIEYKKALSLFISHVIPI